MESWAWRGSAPPALCLPSLRLVGLGAGAGHDEGGDARAEAARRVGLGEGSGPVIEAAPGDRAALGEARQMAAHEQLEKRERHEEHTGRHAHLSEAVLGEQAGELPADPTILYVIRE